MSKTINQLCKEAHQNAIDKGWWDNAPSFGEVIALIHSEASEALECYREGYFPDEMFFEGRENDRLIRSQVPTVTSRKPGGIPSELADVVIRVFDACGHYGIDLEHAIAAKMAYNATRPHKHGGKRI